jgi:large conductance mechanosensitive channel
MWQEFRAFISRGNLVDIAVGFVVGAAFATVVSTFTGRVVSPLIGMLFDLSGLEAVGTFGPIDPETGLPQGSVGAFVQAVLNFLIVGFVMFLVVKSYNRLQAQWKEEEPAPASPPEEIVLLREIRDALNR